jgi:hypothetical protein
VRCNRGVLPALGRLVATLQTLAAALDSRDEPGEVDLERVEDVVGVVGALTRISRSRSRASSMMSSGIIDRI